MAKAHARECSAQANRGPSPPKQFCLHEAFVKQNRLCSCGTPRPSNRDTAAALRCPLPLCSRPCVHECHAGSWPLNVDATRSHQPRSRNFWMNRGRRCVHGDAPPPASSGRFRRLRIYERTHGISLTRGFVAAYLTNARMTRENRPEVRFRSENEGKNLRNRPEVARRRPSLGYSTAAGRRLQAAAAGLQAGGCGLRAAGCGLRKRSHDPRVNTPPSPVHARHIPRRAGYSKNLAIPTGMHWRMRPTSSASSKSMPWSNQWRVQPAQPFEKNSRQNSVSP